MKKIFAILSCLVLAFTFTSCEKESDSYVFYIASAYGSTEATPSQVTKQLDNIFAQYQADIIIDASSASKAEKSAIATFDEMIAKMDAVFATLSYPSDNDWAEYSLKMSYPSKKDIKSKRYSNKSK